MPIYSINSFYKNKRVLVTGASGFIGRHLMMQLKNANAEVAIISRSEPQDIDNCRVFVGSIEDKKFVTKTFEEFDPEVVFHLAAARDRLLTYEAFKNTIEVSLKGTMNLLFSATELKKLKRFIVVGTAEEYGDNNAPFVESMRESSVSAYSFAKQSATHLSQLMHKNFNLPVVIIRPSIAYGPGQSNDMFLPALIQNILSKSEFKMTPGEQTRDYVYVEDLVKATLIAGYAKDVEGEIINIGSGEPIQIAMLVKKVEGLLKSSGVVRLGALKYRPSEQMNYWLDVSKAKRLLNWTSTTSLKDGLHKTIEWYRSQVR